MRDQMDDDEDEDDDEGNIIMMKRGVKMMERSRTRGE